MKKLHLIALMGTAALAAMVSCQRESNPEVNPNYDPDAETVKTAFVLNISTAASTKQSSATVQAGSSDPFRGIQDAFLQAIIQPTNGKLLAADMDASKMYDLSQAVSAGSITETNSRRIFEMSLPLKTNTVLFYGRAPQGQAVGTLSTNDIYGKLDEYTIGTANGSALFQLGKRLQNTSDRPKKVDQFKAVQGLICGILTCTMNTHMWTTDETHDSFTIGNFTLDGTKTEFSQGGYPNLNWKNYTLASGLSPVESTHERYELENKLCNVYHQMTNIQSAAGEIRACSGEDLARTITDLWTIINEIKCAAPFSAAEAVAVRFAEKVSARLATYFEATVPTDGGPVTGLSYKATADIVTALTADITGAKKTWPDASSAPSAAQLSNMSSLLGTISISQFPQFFDVPRGAAYINFDDTKEIFYFPSSFNTSGMGGTTTGSDFNAESYYYPSELLYFGNSPIRVTDSEVTTVQYPGGNNGATYNGAWDLASSWGSWGTWASNNFVKSSTRAVAMVNEVNYGNALLETKVKYGAAILKDNNHKIQKDRDNTLTDSDEPDKEITVGENTFLLTGIVIGGVHQNVGWDYLPCKVNVAAANQPEVMKDVTGFVYDRAIVSSAIPTTGASVPTYTMVFDNFKGTLGSNGIWTADANQDKVYVALEFKNNSGIDFYGNCNMIRNQGYFYLIAELDPAAAGLAAITWPEPSATKPSVHVIPPYNSDGTSQEITRVFIQDFITKATFTIGENSLKHAYLTTPDLRSNSMTFGLSVDLKWENGLDFGDVILGGN